MLLDAASSLLLVVDVQVRLLVAMPPDDPIVRNVSILVRAARETDVPVLASEQYPRGLGPTVPELAELIEAGERHEKVEFSCLANAGLATAIRAAGRKQVVVCGIEAHVCVLQTAIELIDAGFNVHVVTDAAASRSPASRDIALKRLEAAGAVLVTTEMAAFEWVRAASSPHFKAISALVR